MSYLIRIYSPMGGQVLDPFCGSGTTGVASIQEDRNFVGIDLSLDYTRIAQERCSDEKLSHEESNPLELLL